MYYIVHNLIAGIVIHEYNYMIVAFISLIDLYYSRQVISTQKGGLVVNNSRKRKKVRFNPNISVRNIPNRSQHNGIMHQYQQGPPYQPQYMYGPQYMQGPQGPQYMQGSQEPQYIQQPAEVVRTGMMQPHPPPQIPPGMMQSQPQIQQDLIQGQEDSQVTMIDNRHLVPESESDSESSESIDSISLSDTMSFSSEEY